MKPIRCNFFRLICLISIFKRPKGGFKFDKAKRFTYGAVESRMKFGNWSSSSGDHKGWTPHPLQSDVLLARLEPDKG